MNRERSQLEIPIFPLPNVVFFPKTLLPLHIFEPRYRQMVSEAMQGSRWIGMVLRRSGFERVSRPDLDVHPVGGLGRISELQQREGGEFDIVLSGVSRFRILEFVSDHPYRRALVELLDDGYHERPEDQELLSRVLSRYCALIGTERIRKEELEILSRADLVTLVNSICSSIEVAPHEKQQLLEVDELRVRSEALVSVLDQMLAHKQFVNRYSHLRPEDPGRN